MTSYFENYAGLILFAIAFVALAVYWITPRRLKLYCSTRDSECNHWRRENRCKEKGLCLGQITLPPEKLKEVQQ